MKMKKLYLISVLCLFNAICFCQNVVIGKISVQKGVLIFCLNEPYFLPITDTEIDKISNSHAVGLALGKIDLNDVFESISHKSKIVIYASGDNNKIDTVKSNIGVLLVKLTTKTVETKLSSDTAAFNFEYRPNYWGIIRYEIRFDKEVLNIEPILTADKKELKKRLKELRLKN